MPLRFLFVLLCLTGCSQHAPKEQVKETSPVQPESTTVLADSTRVKTEETETGPLVYITKEGDKYHTADCRYAKEAHTVSLQLAKAEGKTACGICKPSSSTGDKQLRCSAKTSDGTQCKRMTSSVSGKCFQHDKP